jgi:two-component system cell cycle response regulator
MRILIAEDDAVSRTIVEAAVARLGHDFISTSDGEAAWQAFQSAEADVIISDRSMPGIDGLELCRRVRSSSSNKYTYFIFVTSSGDKRRALDANEAGADDYLVKPLDPDQLAIRLVVAERITRLYGRLAAQQSELKVLNHRLFDQARLDPLTKLGNRLKLREDLDLLSARNGGRTEFYCALMCDVDHFKSYNDTYGHFAGDKVLESVAGALMNCLRQGDHGYRFGGEEFLLILEAASFPLGCLLAERSLRAIEDLNISHQGGVEKVVTISVGVAQWRQGDDTVSEWLKEADTALYRAKTLGRNRVYPAPRGVSEVAVLRDL